MEKEKRADVLSEQILREWKDAVNALQCIETTLILESAVFRSNNPSGQDNYADMALDCVSDIKTKFMSIFFNEVQSYISDMRNEEKAAKEQNNVSHNSQL